MALVRDPRRPADAGSLAFPSEPLKAELNSASHAETRTRRRASCPTNVDLDVAGNPGRSASLRDRGPRVIALYGARHLRGIRRPINRCPGQSVSATLIYPQPTGWHPVLALSGRAPRLRHA